jgi:membrane protein
LRKQEKSEFDEQEISFNAAYGYSARMSWLVKAIENGVDTLEAQGHVRLARGIDLVIAIGQQLVGREALRNSAALAFTTILSLVPLLAVLFAVLNAFVSSKAVADKIRDWMLDTLFADSVSGIVQHIETFLESSQGAVGLVGLSVLFLASLSLFLSVENSLNGIWQVPNSRPFHRRLITFYVVITLTPTLIALGSLSAEWILASLDTAVLGVTVGGTVSWLLVLVALSLMYGLMPHTHVRLKPALIGALWASIIFQLTRHGFNLYVDMVYTGTVRSKIYGGFALIPVFFLWIYLIWVIILSGVKVTYLLQNRERLTKVFDRFRSEGMDTSGPPTGYLLVRTFYEIAENFTREGGGLSPDMIASRLGLVNHEADPAIRRLITEGLLLEVPHGDDREIAPARPIEQVTVGSVYRLGRKGGFHSGHLSIEGDPLEELLSGAESVHAEQLDKHNFADMITFDTESVPSPGEA